MLEVGVRPPGTVVGGSASIAPGVILGRNCNIGEHSIVAGGVVFGDGVILGRHVILPPNSLLGSEVLLADRVIVSEQVCVRGRNYTFPRSGALTEIGEGAVLGFETVLWRGVHVGAFAMIAPRSVVTTPVPAFALMAGAPARRSGWVCRCRKRLERRAGLGYECSACGQQFAVGRQRIWPTWAAAVARLHERCGLAAVAFSGHHGSPVDAEH